MSLFFQGFALLLDRMYYHNFQGALFRPSLLSFTHFCCDLRKFAAGWRRGSLAKARAEFMLLDVPHF